LRTELQKKKGGKEAEQDPEQKAREELLKKEQVIRDQVAKVVDATKSVLQALGVIAHSNPTTTHEWLSTIIPSITSFAAAPLISQFVLKTYDALAVCVSKRLNSIKSRLINATHLALAIAELQTDKDALLSQQMESLLSDLVGICDTPLPAPSFAYCFPLCKIALKKSYTFSIQENALYLIELHTNKEANFPRSEMLGSLVALLGSISDAPRIQKRASDTMLTLSEGFTIAPEEEEVQLKPLLDGLLSPNVQVRLAVLSSLERVPILASSKLTPTTTITARLWYAKHDKEAENVSVAERTWNLYRQELPQNYFSILSPLLSKPSGPVQDIAGAAIAGAIKRYPSTKDETIKALFNLYAQNLPSGGEDNNPSTRSGVGAALGACASVFGPENLAPLFDFFLHRSLLDPNEEVKQRMDQAALEVIAEHGQQNNNVLLPIFENFLKQPSQNAAEDKVRESVAIMMGSLAKHLGANHEKLPSIFTKLFEVLRTPSEPV